MKVFLWKATMPWTLNILTSEILLLFYVKSYSPSKPRPPRHTFCSITLLWSWPGFGAIFAESEVVPYKGRTVRQNVSFCYPTHYKNKRSSNKNHHNFVLYNSQIFYTLTDGRQKKELGSSFRYIVHIMYRYFEEEWKRLS